MGSGKNGRWRIFFHFRQPRRRTSPAEFLCPISNSLMADPVIVPSGQSFERRCIECLLALSPNYNSPLPPNWPFSFTTSGSSSAPPPPLIPNIALKTAITNWCRDFGLLPPDSPDPQTAKCLVLKLLAPNSHSSSSSTPSAHEGDSETNACRSSSDSISQSYQSIDAGSETNLRLIPIESPEPTETTTPEATRTNAGEDDDRPSVSENCDSNRILDGVHSDPAVEMSYAATQVNRRVDRFDSSDSGSSGLSASLLELSTKPACLSDSFNSLSVSDDSPVDSLSESHEFIAKMKSGVVSDQEEALVSIRNLTRENGDTRVNMCTREILKCLGALMHSRYAGVQVNAVASLVNLSLEKSNKVKIVRSGIIPSLIDVFKGGHVEAQEHAAGAVFSLALDDENKTALGVLGAVQPLVHMLGSSQNSRARLDVAMALYHLSFSRGNRAKLMRAGALPKLMALARGDDQSLASRAVLILCNIASGSEDRAAMLDANATAALVALIAESWNGEPSNRHAEAIREHSVAALCFLARDSWRFKGLAREAGALEVLAKVTEKGSDRARDRAGKLLMLMKGCAAPSAGREADAEGDDDAELVAPARRRHKRLMSGPNSTEF